MYEDYFDEDTFVPPYPIICREDGTLVILSGHHRVMEAHEVGLEMVDIALIDN